MNIILEARKFISNLLIQLWNDPVPWKGLNGLISRGPMNIRILVAIDNFNRSHSVLVNKKSEIEYLGTKIKNERLFLFISRETIQYQSNPRLCSAH